MLYEYDHTVRHIFTDGRAHPADITPTYMGHSIGKWDGDTLVVDTTGFNEKTMARPGRHQHSDQLHVVERFLRVDRDNMQVDITMEDPKALLKPWITQLHFQLKPEWTSWNWPALTTRHLKISKNKALLRHACSTKCIVFCQPHKRKGRSRMGTGPFTVLPKTTTNC